MNQFETEYGNLFPKTEGGFTKKDSPKESLFELDDDRQNMPQVLMDYLSQKMKDSDVEDSIYPQKKSLQEESLDFKISIEDLHSYDRIKKMREEKLDILNDEERIEYFEMEHEKALALEKQFPNSENNRELRADQIALFHILAGSTPDLTKLERLDFEDDDNLDDELDGFSILKFFRKKLGIKID